MQQLKTGFWYRLGLVVITTFIVITYFFEPHDNQCQMTFMMEPPKFIPVPVRTKQDSLFLPANDQNAQNYRLFMYSEFGFPLENNIRRDLKDSMPILFVPGNAGSYQQVRSLASTCIRRQLQSLDAFKFVFYTIDFHAQLSGLSGHLIESQMRFVHSAIKTIIDMHPTETNGVILIGHSVGGFIAKALLASPDFDSNSIPMLISLASPLTRAFVNFDSKMKDLYESAQSMWEERHSTSTTLSISISGGTSDRLVPTRLSFDPQYDISLTTSSIDDVWLSTDHVSITWCRELMNKLARLLSALVDKKRTRLIEGKAQQISIAMNELVTDASNEVENISAPIMNEQTVLETDNVEKFSDSFVAKRSALISSPIILNLTSHKEGDVFVWIEYIENFKKSNIYGCQDVTLNTNRAQCVGKIGLSNRMRVIPSRRFDLKKKCFSIKDDAQIMKYLVLDFSNNLRNVEPNKYKVPESISVQSFDSQKLEGIHIPTLLEYLITSPWRAGLFNWNIVPSRKQQVTYARYHFKHLNRWTQFFSVVIEPTSCVVKDKHIDITVLLTQDGHVGKSFHQDKSDKDKSSMTVRFNAKSFLLLHNKSKIASATYMELFIDSTCGANLKITPDLWGLTEDIIQSYFGHILTLASFIAIHYVRLRSLSIVPREIVSCNIDGMTWAIHATVFLVLFAWNDGFIFVYDLHDNVILAIAIFVLANGPVALIEYLINRLVDLATIINNSQMFIRKRVMSCRKELDDKETRSATQNGNAKRCNETKTAKFDYEWTVIFLTILGGLTYSTILTKLSNFFMLFKLLLKLSLTRSPAPSCKLDSPKKETSNLMIDEIYMLTLSITTISALSLLCNIPAALLRINSTTTTTTRTYDSSFVDLSLIASIASLILSKFLCQKLWTNSFERENVSENSWLVIHVARSLVTLAYLFSLVPLWSVQNDIRLMNYIELWLFVSVLGPLYTLQIKKKKKVKSQ
jgi:pimeloyl-ACP methyl ester carboxylesterase